MQTSAVMAVLDGSINIRLNLAIGETCNKCGRRNKSTKLTWLNYPRGGMNYLHRIYLYHRTPILRYRASMYMCECRNDHGRVFRPSEVDDLMKLIKRHPLWREECINWGMSVR